MGMIKNNTGLESAAIVQEEDGVTAYNLKEEQKATKARCPPVDGKYDY